MIDRNTQKSLKGDIEHLQKMLEISKHFDNFDTVQAEYIQLYINDWIDELEGLLAEKQSKRKKSKAETGKQ